MMNRFVVATVLTAAFAAPLPADTVIEVVPDTLPGKGGGGLSGFMLGAAAGGPVGALVGAGIGWLGGGEVQRFTGLDGQAYRVRRDGGREVIVRSPQDRWSPGDRVSIVGGRLVAASAAPRAGVARAVSVLD